MWAPVGYPVPLVAIFPENLQCPQENAVFSIRDYCPVAERCIKRDVQKLHRDGRAQDVCQWFGRHDSRGPLTSPCSVRGLKSSDTMLPTTFGFEPPESTVSRSKKSFVVPKSSLITPQVQRLCYSPFMDQLENRTWTLWLGSLHQRTCILSCCPGNFHLGAELMGAGGRTQRLSDPAVVVCGRSRELPCRILSRTRTKLQSVYDRNKRGNHLNRCQEE